MKVTNAVQMANGHAVLATERLSHVEVSLLRKALARNVRAAIPHCHPESGVAMVDRTAVKMARGLVSPKKVHTHVGIRRSTNLLTVTCARLQWNQQLDLRPKFNAAIQPLNLVKTVILSVLKVINAAQMANGLAVLATQRLFHAEASLLQKALARNVHAVIPRRHSQ
jgi:hypothetical protein